MKKIISILAFGLLSFCAFAQPTFSFKDAKPDPGQEFCMDVTAEDFTDLVGMTLTITFDTAVVDFVRTANINPSFTGFTAANITNQGGGKLLLNWTFAECRQGLATGITLEDNKTIFSLCFKAKGTYGASSTVTIKEADGVTVFRTNACPNNIGINPTIPGYISTSVRPFRVWASNEEANSGDKVSVDFRVSGFDNMTSTQFSIGWDSTVLEFEEVVPSDNVPNLSLTQFGLPGSGAVPKNRMTLAWERVKQNDSEGVSIADSSLFFTMNFKVKAPCESMSPIQFLGEPTRIEITNIIKEGFKLLFVPQDGSVKVSTCEPKGLKMTIDCGPEVELGDEVCVKITSPEFISIRSYNHLLRWSSAILEFKEIRNVNPALGSISSVILDEANVDNGILGMKWESPSPGGTTLPNPVNNIVEVCFKVIGLGGNSPMNIPRSPSSAVSRGQDIGINPTNCEVKVKQPAQLTIQPGKAEAPVGDTICLPVKVLNFKDIEQAQFSLAWEPTLLKLVDVKDFALAEPGKVDISASSFEAGFLSFIYDPTLAETLPNGVTLFNLCFQVLADPGDCSDITLNDIPTTPEFKSVTTGETTQAVFNDNPGQVCSLFPEGFKLLAVDTIGDFRDTVCMNIKAVSFDNIIQATFGLTFDPASLRLNSIKLPPSGLPNLTLSSFDTTSAQVGRIAVNWNSGGTPAVLPDSTTVFSVCYELIGEPDSCHTVDFADNGMATTANGAGSIFFNAGEICIKEKIFIDSIIVVPASCPGVSDGSITLLVNGGRAPVGFSWQTNPPQFSNRARNLPAGKVIVTVFDNSFPSITVSDTIDVPLNENIPFASAGDDVPFVCSSNLVRLDGDGSDGPYTYKWSTANGSLTSVTNEKTTNALREGTYVFAVTNVETGCVATDTVQVLAPLRPKALAGANTFIDCVNEVVTIGDNNSDKGAGITHQWTFIASLTDTVSGLFPGEEKLLTPRVNRPGVYVLTSIDSNSGCDGRDTVVVEDRRKIPAGIIDADVELRCDNAPVFLKNTSSNSFQVTKEWFTLAGQSLGTGDSIQVSTAGQYVLRVTGVENRCVRTDTAAVLEPTSLPRVSLEVIDTAITCLKDTLQIFGDVEGATDFSFTWTAINGGTIVAAFKDSLNTRIATAGTYILSVTNRLNRCTDMDSITIGDIRKGPAIDAGQNVTISCQDSVASLTVTVPASGIFTYLWTKGADTIGTTKTITTKIADLFMVEVTDSLSGCTATDSVRVLNSADRPSITFPVVPDLTCQNVPFNLAATLTPATGLTLVWEKVDTAGAKVIEGAKTATLPVSTAGTYRLTATNAQGCKASNELTIKGSVVLPVITLPDTAAITCQNDTLALKPSFTGADSVTVKWTTLGSGSIQTRFADSLTTRILTTGRYQVRITNKATGCSATDSVVVVENKVTPAKAVIEGGDSLFLSCQSATATLKSTGSSPLAGSVTYLWIRDGRLVASGVPTLDVNEAGKYFLAVRDTVNGCSVSDSVQVVKDSQSPAISLTPVVSLNCTQDTVDITATITNANRFSVVWTTENGGIILGRKDTTVIRVAIDGVYNIRVTNTETGCLSEGEVLVNANFSKPEAIAGVTQSLDCQTTSVQLAGRATSGPNIRYRWSGLNGAPTPAPDSSLTPTVSTIGSYLLTVIDLNNGCVATDTVEVINNSAQPVVRFAPAVIGCSSDTATIDATSSSINPNNTDAQWVALDGGRVVRTTNPLIVKVSSVGRYALTLKNTVSGCTSTDTVTVTESRVIPIAVAGRDTTVPCSSAGIMLNGLGSSVGDSITYTWRAVVAGTSIQNDTTLTPTVKGAGTYVLQVQNRFSKCTATDTVVVRLANNLPTAMAGADASTCVNNVNLSATPVTGVTGTWSAGPGIVFTTPTSITSAVTGLKPGQNALVWTLSAADCPSYSSDTVVVTVAASPVAIADKATLAAKDSVITINVVENDVLTNISDFTIGITTPVTKGTLVEGTQKGTYIYTKNSGATGKDQFVYEICNVECPDRCAEVRVEITLNNVTVTPINPDSIPNGITPNGDGVNDQLIFDQLEEAPEKYPNNELIIFNRWGNIIYQAKPYTNDWEGLNEGGLPLPAATYYYIMRLDINEGEIIRGSVTIIR